jgi:hypothetical protein
LIAKHSALVAPKTIHNVSEFTATTNQRPPRPRWWR